MQCAVGAGDEQFLAMSTTVRERATRFEAALDIVRRLCAGEEVTTDAPWPIARAKIAAGAAGTPRSLDRRRGAARHRPRGAPRRRVPHRTGSHAAGGRAARRGIPDACARHGRDAGVIAVRRDIHVGADDADAERVAGPIIARGYRGFDPSAPVTGSPAQRRRGLRGAGRSRMHRRHRPPPRRRPTSGPREHRTPRRNPQRAD